MLRTSRLYEETFEKDKLQDVEGLTLKHEPKAATLEFGFDFDVKADALYKLLMPRLPVALATEFRQAGQTNGFELYRRLVQKLDFQGRMLHSTSLTRSEDLEQATSARTSITRSSS